MYPNQYRYIHSRSEGNRHRSRPMEVGMNERRLRLSLNMKLKITNGYEVKGSFMIVLVVQTIEESMVSQPQAQDWEQEDG